MARMTLKVTGKNQIVDTETCCDMKVALDVKPKDRRVTQSLAAYETP